LQVTPEIKGEPGTDDTTWEKEGTPWKKEGTPWKEDICYHEKEKYPSGERSILCP